MKRWVVRRLRSALGVDALDQRSAAATDQVHELRALADHLRGMRLDDQLDALHAAVAELAAFRQVVGGTLLTEVAPLATSPRISVVLATRDRRDLLARAIASVQAQSYPTWELVVVDDGSSDGTADLLGSLTDDRIVVLHAGGSGAAAARNVGLAAARGEWVTFLDDDNLMAPGWLRGIAHFAATTPGASALYGAQLRQYEPQEGRAVDTYLWYVTPFDLDRLRAGNFIDLGAFAARRDLPEVRFDESLARFIDWEMIVRVAATTDVHPVPVLSGYYFTSHQQRITHRGELDAWRAFADRLADPDDPVGTPMRPPG